jgi:hypothetical protein
MLNLAMTLAEFYGTWKYYLVMAVLLIVVIVIFMQVRKRQG